MLILHPFFTQALRAWSVALKHTVTRLFKDVKIEPVEQIKTGDALHYGFDPATGEYLLRKADVDHPANAYAVEELVGPEVHVDPITGRTWNVSSSTGDGWEGY